MWSMKEIQNKQQKFLGVVIMTKYILAAVIILAFVALAGCVNTTVAIGEQKTYEISPDTNSLNIEINAAEFVIVHGDELSVESNLKNLTVNDANGVLKIVEKTRNAVSYNGAMLKLCIPEDVVFENIEIKTGAARLTAQSVTAKNVKLKLGAGQVQFDSIEAKENINIKGGAGQINILDGKLNNLTLDLGVGELDMTAALTGDSNLKFGVSESDITLIGSKDDYNFNIKNGVGKITIDNMTGSNYVSSGSGDNYVRIKGGVGATNISFQE